MLYGYDDNERRVNSVMRFDISYSGSAIIRG